MTTLDSTESLLVNTNQTIGQDATSEYLDESPYLDPMSFFPVTMSLIILMHVVFLYQTIWTSSSRRKGVVVTYQSIVRRKRFHKLWLALLSHPPIQETYLASGSSSSSNDRDSPPPFGGRDDMDRPFASTIAMGGPAAENDRWALLQGNGVAQQILRNVLQCGKWQWRRLTEGSLSGFPLLLYNSHILWSCRALEQVYNDADSYKYARSLLVLVTLGVAVELLLSHIMVQATVRRRQATQQPSADAFGEIQPTFDGSLDSTVFDQIRQRVEKRAIGTMATLTSAILVLFHFQYTGVPLAILPFFPGHFMSRYPGITYLLCLSILTMLARSSHPMGVVTGALVGLFWVAFSLDFLSDTYHGNWFVLVTLFLTLLSWKGESPRSIPCIEYVSWYDPDVRNAPRDEMRPLSWCLQPLDPNDDDDDDDNENASLDGENDHDHASADHRAQEALLEFTRVRSIDSDSPEAPGDPDLLEQGRRPRRTRIQSQRL